MTTAVHEIFRDAEEEPCDGAHERDTEREAATQPSDQEKTYEIRDEYVITAGSAPLLAGAGLMRAGGIAMTRGACLHRPGQCLKIVLSDSKISDVFKHSPTWPKLNSVNI